MARRSLIVTALAGIASLAITSGAAGQVSGGAGLRYLTGFQDTRGGHTVIEGNRLYMGAYGQGMRIFDITDPAAPKPLGQYTPGGRADAVPDAMRYGGREFAVLNGTNRAAAPVGDVNTRRAEFFDSTDPARLTLLHMFTVAADAESHNGDIVDNRKLWLPSGGNGPDGLRIYDLTGMLETPAASCRPTAEDNPCKPQNIFRGSPSVMWENSPYRGDKPVGNAFTHTHDITIYTDYPVQGMGLRDIALLAEGGNYTQGNNLGGAFVIDITDPRNPVVLQRWIHQAGPGHHALRYGHEAQFLDGDLRVMLVTDEDLHGGPNCTGAGGVYAMRLSDDLRNATELSEWYIPAAPAPVCSVHVFSSAGSTVFFGSYNAGLQVVDYSDPTKPKQIAYDIRGGSTAWGATYHQGYVYQGDMDRGLDVYRWELPVGPSAFGRVHTPGPGPGPGGGTTPIITRPSTGKRLLISRRNVRVGKRGTVGVRLTCASSRPCTGSLRLRTAQRFKRGRKVQRIVMGRRAFNVQGNRKGTVTLRLSRGDRALLRRQRRLRVLVIANLRPETPGGRAETVTASFRLVRGSR